MEKYVGLNPAWFEPGPDGESMFEREYYNHRESGTMAGNAIAAAFRALLAGEAAQEPPALQVGDVVRLEACPERSKSNNNFFTNRTFTIEEIVEKWDVDKPCAWFTVPDSPHGQGVWWPVSALTLIRRAGEAVPVDKDAKDAEIAELRAEVERLDKWRIAMNSLTPNGSEYVHDLDRCVSVIRERFQSGHEAKKALARMTAERDAARAEVERLRDDVVNIQRDRDSATADLRKISNLIVNGIGGKSLFGNFPTQTVKFAIEEFHKVTAERDAARDEVERLESEYHDKSEWCNRWQGVITEERQKNALLTAEVERLTSERDVAFAGRDELQKDYDSLFDEAEAIRIERDALRARIDAGVRVYDGPYGWLETEGPDSTLTAILIDRDHIADPGKMVDERTGPADRRENRYIIGGRRDYPLYLGDARKTVEFARCNDRRRTPGTIADRKEAS